MQHAFLSPKSGSLSGKFSPPRSHTSRSVYRRELIEGELLDLDEERRRYVFMEANAGQGKTTTALQYVERIGHPFAWYQLGEEDCDPITFLSSFIKAIEVSTDISPLTSGALLHSGEVKGTDLPGATRHMMDEITSFLTHRMIIVLDDLHLLCRSPKVFELLDCILECDGSTLSFLLLSRYPLPIKSKKVRFGSKTVYLTRRDLAFTLAETKELLDRLNHDHLSYDEVLARYRRAEGWVMGLILGSYYVGMDDESMISTGYSGKDMLRKYFRKEVLASLEGNMQQHLLELSLLEEIPLPLGERITGSASLGSDLETLMERNQFVRLFDGNIATFSLHHLLREMLRREFTRRSTQSESEAILKQAIQYYLDEGSMEKAAVYVQRLKDSGVIDDFLKNHGLTLIARNRLATLERCINGMDEGTRSRSAWVSFFQGLSLAETNPDESGAVLRRSLSLFRNAEERQGELLALSYLIFNYFLTAKGASTECRHLLDETIELYRQIGEKLPRYGRVYSCRNIGLGFLLFTGQMDQVRTYLEEALDHARYLHIPNLMVTSWIFIGYSYLIAGRFGPASQLAESLFEYINSEGVGIESRLIAHHFLTDYLQFIDDYPNYLRFKAQYHTIAGKEIIEGTQLGPSILLWDVKFHISRGEIAEAEILIEKGLESGPLYQTPHIRSRFLEYRALAQALQKKSSAAVLADIKESIFLRKTSSWSGFFLFRHFILVGTSFSLLHRFDEGEKWITDGIDGAKSLNLPLLEVNGLMLRAYSKFSRDADREGEEDLREGLHLMRTNGYGMFWGWYPGIIESLLEQARYRCIETSFVKKLCYRTLHSGAGEDGETIPLLHIRVLGEFRLTIDGRNIIEAVDFTPLQRALFGTLLAARGRQVNQEKMQNILWPNESSVTARRNLDTLLSRLRAMMKPLLSPEKIQNYLKVSRGIVFLQNCRVDAEEFCEHVEAGTKFADAGKWFQASNHFYKAQRLWQGCFAEEVFGDDLSYGYCMELRTIFLRMARRWGLWLQAAKRKDEARQILTEAQKIHPADQRVARCLYRLYFDENDADGAEHTLQAYQQGLRRQGASKADVDRKVSEVLQI